MQRPPPKPKTPDDLAEVERALSVLKGRTPEYERARREDEEARAKRRADLEAASRVESKKARKRSALIAAGAIVVIVVTVWAGTVFRSEVARRGHVEQASDSYRAMGFVVVETSGRASPGRLEDTPEKGCLLAVSTGDAPITVTRPSGKIEGPGPILFCTCAPEHVTVTSDVDQTGGLSLLRIDAAEIGGSRAFAFLPFRPGTTARADDACSDAALDAWIDDKRYPAAPPPEDTWLKADETRMEELGRLDLHTIAVVPGDRPFSVVTLPKQSCTVVVGKPNEPLALRTKGGVLSISSSGEAFAWCAADVAVAVVQREGEGEVTVLAAPAALVGGTVGLAEALTAAGVKIAPNAIGTPGADRAWNAKQLLVASAVPEGVITIASAPQIPPDPEARIAAVSFATPKALVVEPAADVFSFCDPPLEDGSTDALCVFSGRHTWRISNAEAVAGVARAKLPFWLFALKDESDPAAMKAASDLVTFARRMRREGFEPTTIEAMTELPNGVDVLGRMGEDAVVALGVAPSAPWLFPYTDGPEWTTDGEPRIVTVQPLEKVKIVTRAHLPSKETRRSIVFRRQKKS